MAVPDKGLTKPADPNARAASVGAGTTDDPNILRARPNHKFALVCYPDHPGNWSACEIEAGPGVPEEDVGVWLLPTLQRESMQPGVCGHRTIKKGMSARAAYDDAHKVIERDGGIVLDPDSFEYLVERDCIDKTGTTGTYFMDTWQTPRSALRGQRIKFDFDRQRYRRWILSLMREGYLPQPDPQIIAIKKNRAAARVTRREGLIDLPPERREVYTDDARTFEEKIKAAKVAGPEAAPKRAAPRGKPGTTQKKGA